MKRTIQVLNITQVISNINQHEQLNKRKQVKANIAAAKLDYVPAASQVMNYEIRDYGTNNVLTINGPEKSSFKFVPKVASLEYRHNDIWENNTNKLKPRNKMYGENFVPMAVVSRENEVYLLILSSSTADFSKIKKILGIEAEQEGDTRISPDLFTWLFYKFQTNNKKISEFIRIHQITGFLSAIGLNSDSDVVSAKSGSVESLSATKLEIALNHTLRSMELALGFDNISAKFTVDEHSFLLIDTVMTDLGDAFDSNYQEFNGYHKLMSQAVYIFVVLLPLLNMEYEQEKESFLQGVQSYRERLARELIDKIFEVHPSLKEEIEQN